MRGLGRLLWLRKGRILGVTLIFAVAAFVVVNLITPQFRSEARLLLESRENVFLRADADKNSDRSAMDAEAVTSQTQLVLSRELARDVIAKEKLADKNEFNPVSSVLRTILGLFGLARDPGSMTREERTLEAYYERLNVYAIEKSRVIAIDFTSADPAACRQRRQHDRRQLSADAAGGEAGTDARRRRVARRRDRQDAREGRRRRGQGRGLSRQVEPVCRLQQFVAVEPAAYRDQFADLRGARPAGRPARRGRCSCARSSSRASRSTPPTSPIANRSAA